MIKIRDHIIIDFTEEEMKEYMSLKFPGLDTLLLDQDLSTRLFSTMVRSDIGNLLKEMVMDPIKYKRDKKLDKLLSDDVS